jgi:hypothetical protein
VSIPGSCRDNSAERCSSYVKYCMHRLQNSAFFVVAGVFHFIKCRSAVFMFLDDRKLPAFVTSQETSSLKHLNTKSVLGLNVN